MFSAHTPAESPLTAPTKRFELAQAMAAATRPAVQNKSNREKEGKHARGWMVVAWKIVLGIVIRGILKGMIKFVP